MKLKKILKLLSPYETVCIWGKDENAYLYRGEAKKVPQYLCKLEAIKNEGTYIDIRYGCCDCDDHVALFVEEKD